jgi:hypothetical protein
MSLQAMAKSQRLASLRIEHVDLSAQGLQQTRGPGSRLSSVPAPGQQESFTDGSFRVHEFSGE